MYLCACTRARTSHTSVKTQQCSRVAKACERQIVLLSLSLLASHAQACTTRMRNNVFSGILVRVHSPAHFRIRVAKNCRHCQKNMCSRRTQGAGHFRRFQPHSCTVQQRPTCFSNRELTEVSSVIKARIFFSLSFVFALSSARSCSSCSFSRRAFSVFSNA